MGNDCKRERPREPKDDKCGDQGTYHPRYNRDHTGGVVSNVDSRNRVDQPVVKIVDWPVTTIDLIIQLETGTILFDPPDHRAFVIPERDNPTEYLIVGCNGGKAAH